MIGERLGKWVIYKELGRGGMGRVYLAQEEIGGRQAAIKVLAAELAQESGFLQRFQREIATLGQLDHPHIVRFFESGLENGFYFYAMEYVDGPSLEDVLEEKDHLAWREVLDIALQVCPALKHAHDHGVIHRDLKPANILQNSAGFIKLTDFGIAKVFAQGHLTATGGIVGTAEYLSPEQAAGKPVSKRSDLYSLGAVLYTLLIGRPPFVGDSFLDLLHKHRYAQFDKPKQIRPDVPYELDELVCQLLAKDPADRPPDCLVLSRQLEAIRCKLERKSHPTFEGSADAGTVAENKVSSVVLENGPGPATLMSRLMRQELDYLKHGGPLNQLLNRWFVVVPLFLVVAGILVWTVWPLSPETQYERGAALMTSKDHADWETAWREYLEPLQRNHPDHPHKAEVDGFRRQIEAHRQALEIGFTASEGQRLYELGEKLRQDGRFTDARRLWTNLATVFKNVDSEKEWAAKAERAVASLDKTATDKQRLAPVRAALEQAKALREQGQVDQAEAIWRGLEELYQNDPAATEVLQSIKAERLKK
jgi:serine/threonine protein kinase